MATRSDPGLKFLFADNGSDHATAWEISTTNVRSRSLVWNAQLIPQFINGVAQAVGTAPGDVGQPFVNNQVPIQNAAVASALTALIPAPNGTSSGGLTDQWYATPTLPTHWRQELFKIDHNINSKLRASFRYIHDSWNQQYPVPLWTSVLPSRRFRQTSTIPASAWWRGSQPTITPTLLNEFVASYTTDHISTQLSGPWQRGNGSGNLGLYDNGFGRPKVPGISLSDGQYSFRRRSWLRARTGP